MNIARKNKRVPKWYVSCPHLVNGKFPQWIKELKIIIPQWFIGNIDAVFSFMLPRWIIKYEKIERKGYLVLKKISSERKNCKKNKNQGNERVNPSPIHDRFRAITTILSRKGRYMGILPTWSTSTILYNSKATLLSPVVLAR